MKSIFTPQAYVADKNQETQFYLEASRQAQNQQLHEERQALQKAEMQLRAWQHQSNLDFQAEQQEAQRLLTLQEGERNRAMMRELEELRQDFQAHENQLSREHSLKVEEFRANMQRWVITEQKATQLRLKEIDVQLARELRLFDRETALGNIREQRRLQNLPICVTADQLLSSSEFISPLHVFISPPRLRAERVAHASTVEEKDPTRLLPPMETHLATKLRAFFQRYNEQQRPVGLVSGAWMSKTLYGDAAALQVFTELKTEAVLILESSLEGYTFTLNYAFWGMNWDKPRYNTALSLNWRETLFDLVKVRTLEWQEKQQGKTPQQIEELYGKARVEQYLNNVKIMERERVCLEEGIDLTDIDRPYFVIEKDYNTLIALLIAYQCIFSGLLADEYYLLHVPVEKRRPPLLPSLLAQLPQLLSANDSGLNVEIPSESLQEIASIIVDFYERLYAQLAQQEPAWMPELYLELAESLAVLDDKNSAKRQLECALSAFVQLRHGDSVQTVVMANDVAYFQRVNACFQAIGENQYFDIVTICYQRGLQALAIAKEAQAVIDFSQVIEINPQFIDAYFQRGLAQHLLGLYPQAVEDFSQVLELDTQSAEAYYQCGRAYDELGANEPEVYYPLAIEDFEKCLQLNPQHPQAGHDLRVVQASWKRYNSEVERKQREQARLAEEARIRQEAEKQERLERERKEQEEQERIRREKGIARTFSTVKEGQSGEFTVYEKTFDVNGTELVMVYVPAGEFIMGSNNGSSDEKPVHKVKIEKAFYMGKYPVTQAQWQAVMGNNPSNWKGDNLPVERVRWENCIAFCEKLSKLSGKTIRLPSEAEWEYACRAGTTTAYWWGGNMDGNRCWYGENSGETTHPVDEKVNAHTNPFGLCDMSGNVWEWTHSDYTSGYDGNELALSENTSKNKTLRGGSWNYNADFTRSANRYYYEPSYLNLIIGFRVVLISP
ncbi:SUMF1/EgtB/PvdO family nonheme iron enzyme [Beggiatoa leptomitoformis]|nr:SUMF1/EgtB/PvdO family nonheme iron enzyme [Beggiatoa leptomitoformis]